MPEHTIVETEYESGYVVSVDESGNRTRYPNDYYLARSVRICCSSGSVSLAIKFESELS